ncbi:PIN domain-containing protein [Nonomuraea dietziae]|uniref:PIN domain-containing protein n=1 Tax=Nonomuraea dietziae TaxID=65515 RepID=UPI0031D41EB5
MPRRSLPGSRPSTAPTLHTSVLVLGEIRKGVEQTRRRDPAQAAAFESWLSRLQNEFGLRITPVTAEVAEEWGRFNAVRTVPVVIDALIGATARAPRLDARHSQHQGLRRAGP